MVMKNGNAIKLSVLCSVLPSPCPALRVSVRIQRSVFLKTRYQVGGLKVGVPT